MDKCVFFSTVVIACVIAGIAPADELKSGLQIGDMATQAFTVQDITGPNRGESLCYR